MRVLLGPCVWAQFLRRNRPRNDPVVQEVKRLIRADVVERPGPIRRELLSGAQPQARFPQLREYLRFYPNLPPDEHDDENAAHHYNLCRRHGVQATATACGSSPPRPAFDLDAKDLPLARQTALARTG